MYPFGINGLTLDFVRAAILPIASCPRSGEKIYYKIDNEFGPCVCVFAISASFGSGGKEKVCTADVTRPRVMHVYATRQLIKHSEGFDEARHFSEKKKTLKWALSQLPKTGLLPIYSCFS